MPYRTPVAKLNAAIRKAKKDKNKLSRKQCWAEKSYWEATHRMYGKKLSKLELAQLLQDWKLIRARLELTIPFAAQLRCVELYLRKALKDNQTVQAVMCARGFRFETDPPHNEENPSFAELYANATTEDQRELIKDVLLQAWFGKESVDKLDDDAADESGGPVGEVCWEFLVQYRRHCALILQGKAKQLTGLMGTATEAILLGCRITVSLVRTEPNVMGTQYEETFWAFDKKREERWDDNLESYLELMSESKNWTPKIATHVIDADNDDVTGSRFQNIMARCVAEESTVALVQDATTELSWLVTQKHRPTGYNRFILKLAAVAVRAIEGKEDGIGSPDATTILTALRCCRTHLSMDVKFPHDATLKKLEQRTSKERRDAVTKEVELMAKNFEGKDAEMKELLDKLDQLTNEESLTGTLVQELKDMRGSILGKLIRLVRNSQQRDEAFQKTTKLQGQLLSSISNQVLIRKEDVESTEKECVASSLKLADGILDMKGHAKDLEADLEDNPDINKPDFRIKLRNAKDAIMEYDKNKEETKEKKFDGSTYISNLTTEGDPHQTKLLETVTTQCKRLDNVFEGTIIKETKRVTRVNAGGDKKDWKENSDGKEKLSDSQFVQKCKELEKSFHESDFLERAKSLKEEPVAHSGAACPACAC